MRRPTSARSGALVTGLVAAGALVVSLTLPAAAWAAPGGGSGKGKPAATATADRPADRAGSAAGRRPARPAARPAAKPRPVPFSLNGVVVSADTASVTVAVRHASNSVRVLRGKTVTVPVAEGTKVVKNGRRTSAAVLSKGDKVSIGGLRQGNTLVTRWVAASGRWAHRPVTPRPDTVNPTPDTP